MEKMKILQINLCNFGSTGNIMLNIGKEVGKHGAVSYYAYPDARSNRKKKVSHSLLIGSILERNLHRVLAYITGFDGCFSLFSTYRFLLKVNTLNPDIIHLHNLHDRYINLPMLFKYLKKNQIPVLWTLHDCWSFTGQCPYFTAVECYKWQTGCYACPQYRSYPETAFDNTKIMYKLKKKWFCGVKGMQLITPSQWLADRVKESYLKEYPVKVIHNGIDLNVFYPQLSSFKQDHGLEGRKMLLGVANPWSPRKGLQIFIELAALLDESFIIVLVGLSAKQIEELPDNMLKFGKTRGQQELAEIYAAADIFINPSVEESMGLVTVEALACGTPAIVSNSTAVPEMVNPESGVVVKEYSAHAFYKAIMEFDATAYNPSHIAEWVKRFDSIDRFQDYYEEYCSLLENS